MSGDKSTRSTTPTAAPPADEGLSGWVDELTPLTPDPTVRSRLVAELRERERWTVWTASVAELLGISTDDALFALQRIEDASAWRPGMWPNSRYLQTPKLAEVRALIASMPPGTQIARHPHAERELTYVLDGELVEDERRTYRSGDLVDMAPGTAHQMTAVGTSDCLVVLFFPREGSNPAASS